jgi:thiosulfate/3-mercaptopyruvate sulfurtransferase
MNHTIISAAWLASHWNDPQVVVVDCRFSLMQPELGLQQYQDSHIPGAYYLDLNRDLSGPISQHGGRHPLPTPNELADKFSRLGIVSEPEPTLVVAYDDSRLAFAARLWWLLRYLGHDRVAVLDGGWTAWKEAGYPVTTDCPPNRAGHFVPQIQTDMIVNIDQVKACKDQPGIVLVDSREDDRYRGEREPIDPIAGHIPPAVNYPWQDVTTANGYIRPVEELQQRWADIHSAAEIIVYCGSGVTACVNLLSLELAGITHTKLYAGSWSDWCSYLV